MKIGSINEDLNLEKRISITPSIAKKITELGLKIFINENYAEHLGISDREYKNIGVNILKDKKEVTQISELSLLINLGYLYHRLLGHDVEPQQIQQLNPLKHYTAPNLPNLNHSQVNS